MTIASNFRALADLYKSVGKRLPWTEQELLSGLPEGRAIASQDLALEAARREAEALGLPAGNTAMERAAAMGYTTPAFHGTSRDPKAFDNAMLGVNTGALSAKKAHFASSDKVTANSYLPAKYLDDAAPAYAELLNKPEAWNDWLKAETNADKWSVLEKHGMSHGQLGQVMPLMLNMGKTKVKDYMGAKYRDETYNEVIKSAKKGKYDSVEFKRTEDPGGGWNSDVARGDVYAVFDPSNIRSRFAAFNPALKDSSNLLAGLGGAAVGIGALTVPGESEAGIAGRLAKNADLDMLKVAAKAETHGLPPEKIYDATGWARGPDGKWRWEFDDSGAKFNVLPATGKETGVGRGYGDFDYGGTFGPKDAVLAHPKLSESYAASEIAPKTFIRDSQTMLGTERGAFNPADKSITLYAPAPAEQGRSVLLHELQHAIQQREGFARGGNPEAMFSQVTESALQRQKEIADRLSQIERSDASGLRRSAKPGYEDEYSKLKQEFETVAAGKVDPMDLYRRLAGEVEARNVQTRMGMTPDERRMRPFWQTEDVPRAQQIVQGQSDTSPYANMMALKRAANDRAKTADPGTVKWMGQPVPNTSPGKMPTPNTRALTRDEGKDLANAGGTAALDPGRAYIPEPVMNDYTVSYVMNRKPPDMNAGEWLYRIKDAVSPGTYARLAEAVWAEGLRGPRSWTTPSPMKGALLGGTVAAGAGTASAYAPPPEFDPERDMMRDAAFTAAGRSALLPTRDTSPYANMMALKRAANDRARTHTPRAPLTPGAEAARTLAIEAMNPAAWPLLWGSRELGDPQALDYGNPYYSYSGATRR